MKITIEDFKGIKPRVAAHLLSKGDAQSAINCKLESGSVGGWKKPEIQEQLSTTDTLTLFQYITGTTLNWVTSTKKWNEVRPPIANDSYERLYLTGSLSEILSVPYDEQDGEFTIGEYIYQTVGGVQAIGTIVGDENGILYVVPFQGTYQDGEPTWEANFGADLWDADAAAFTTGTYSWAEEGTNTIANVSNALQITFVDSAQGATVQLNDAADLSADLVVGQFYYLTVKCMIDEDSATIEVRQADETILATAPVVTQALTTHTLVFQATHATTNELTVGNLVTGQVFTIDDISIKNLTDAALATDDSSIDDFFLPRYFANDVDSSPWDADVDYVRMGIPEPENEPAFVSGSTGGSDYRAYVYTRVNRYGIEGPPSPVLDTETYNDTSKPAVVFDGFEEPIAGHACRSVVGDNAPSIRLYRTSSDGAGLSAFLFVNETPVSISTNYGSLEITDDVLDEDLGEVLPSVGWLPPERNMRGMIGLSNGIFVGFYGNELYLSEPYHPDAWPTAYSRTFSETIIGLGYFGTNIVVCTDEGPYLVYGTHPSQMTKQRVPGFYPCLSKDGVVSTEHGVFYPSKEGIILVNQNGLTNTTKDFLTSTDMNAFYPHLWTSIYYSGKYYAFYVSGETFGGIIFDTVNAIFSQVDAHVTAQYLSRDDSFMYVNGRDNQAVSTEYILQWEGDEYNFMEYIWKSKKFIIPRATNVSTARVMVDVDFYNTVVDLIEEDGVLAAQNAILFTESLQGAINRPEVDEFPLNGSTLHTLSDLSITADIGFKLYVDSILRFQTTVSSDKAFKLPSGFRGRRWEVEINGFIPVRQVTLGPSTREVME